MGEDGDDVRKLKKNLREYIENNWSTEIINLRIFDKFKGILKERAIALGYAILAPFKKLWNNFVKKEMYVKENCPVCKGKKKKKHIVAHCPYCKSPVHSNGSVRGIPRFTCYRHNKPKNFTLNTCMEHRIFLYLCAIRVLEYIGNGVALEGIKKITGVTRCFIEKVVCAVDEKLKGYKISGNIDDDIIFVYIDGLFAVKGCILISKIKENIIWKTCEYEDYVSIKNLLLSLKDIIKGKNIVFVTDGLNAHVDAIREVFPDAIHVGHFHNTIEDIFVHFPYKNEIYTLHLKWDVFINGGEKNATLWKGIKYSINKNSNAKDKRSDIEKIEEIIKSINKEKKWNGRLMQKFSRRIEIIGDKIIKNKISLEEFRNVLSKIKWNELSLKFKLKLKERIENVYERIDRKEIRERKKIKRKIKKLCEGEIKYVAKNFPQVEHVIDVLKKEFNGKHISTNPVEGVHSRFLPLLRTHRTEKGTTRLINVVLHICFSLHTFEQILPFEEFSNIKVKREKECRLKIGKEYLIRYVNASNIVTERVIRVVRIDKRKIDAYCYRKNEIRTFRKDRIMHCTPLNR